MRFKALSYLGSLGLVLAAVACSSGGDESSNPLVTPTGGSGGVVGGSGHGGSVQGGSSGEGGLGGAGGGTEGGAGGDAGGAGAGTGGAGGQAGGAAGTAGTGGSAGAGGAAGGPTHAGKGNPDSVGNGARKTIVIDGANTNGEWGDDTLLIRDPAADDARFLGTNWSAHEPPWDYAGLHAAWDDNYLYIGIQYVNVTDVVDPSNVGSSAGSRLKGMDLVQFVVFNTVAGEGYKTGGDMWGKDQAFVGEDHPDYQLYFHSNFSQEGTYWGAWDGTKLVQTTDGTKEPTLQGAAGDFFVGSTLPGVDPHADDSDPGNYGAASVDYLSKGHDTSYDTFFELRIPLKLLKITSARLDKGTIGVFAGNGDGSGVDSVPNDMATSSTPGVSASNSPLEWDPADDDDNYTSAFAWIGTP